MKDNNEELKKELRKEVKEELKQKLGDELKDDLKEEIREEMKEEIVEEEVDVEKKQENFSKGSSGNKMSRRSFLKRAGLGAAGLAALASPVSGLDVRDQKFDVYTQDSGSVKSLSVDGNGNVEIPNGDFGVGGRVNVDGGRLNFTDLNSEERFLVGDSEENFIIQWDDSNGIRIGQADEGFNWDIKPSTGKVTHTGNNAHLNLNNNNIEEAGDIEVDDTLNIPVYDSEPDGEEGDIALIDGELKVYTEDD